MINERSVVQIKCLYSSSSSVLKNHARCLYLKKLNSMNFKCRRVTQNKVKRNRIKMEKNAMICYVMTNDHDLNERISDY